MVIVGLQDGHGASVALLINGKVVKIAEEERFSRIKGDSGFPIRAMDYIMDAYDEAPRKADYVAVGYRDIPFKDFATKRYPYFGIKEFLIEEEKYWIPTLLKGEKIDYLEAMKEYVDFSLSAYPLHSINDRCNLEEVRRMRQSFIAEYLKISPEKVIFVDHHTCHAHHAYFSSPLREDVLVLTMDGFGDGTNATVHIAESDGRLNCLYRTDLCNIGRIYQYITLLLGMKPAEHEYKVMGLAPYAKEYYIKEALKIFEATYYVEGLEFKIDKPIKNHYQYFKERMEGFRFDAIAGALQRYTENLLAEWTRNWIKYTKLRNVVFSGGVALNIKASKRIAELSELKNIFICMGGGDESLAVGAAQYQFSQVDISSRLQPITIPYLGAGFDRKDIEDALESPVIQKSYNVIGHVSYRDIAKLLADGNIVALMIGDMEFGPRALGHRSIIADPRDLKIIRTINEVVKNRDFWMPFTPSILKERAADYLVNPKGLIAPYMTMAFDTTELARRDLAAAIHPYDLTIRPQVVVKEYSPEYYEIIKEFENLTGVGGVLNTSFNIHGKPIVHKPVDAAKEVLSHESVYLKYVLFNDILISRKE